MNNNANVINIGRSTTPPPRLNVSSLGDTGTLKIS